MKFYKNDEIELAFNEAKKDQKPVLIDFWSEGCKGCKKMDNVTYKSNIVLEYLEENYIVVKFNTAMRETNFRNSYLSSPYLWTPCLIVFANDGSEVRKNSGYLPPVQFVDELKMGKAFAQIRKSKSELALKLFNQIILDSNNEQIIQESLYWAGVSAFYANRKSIDSLKPYWEDLMSKFPNSIWGERANCLDVIID